MKEEYLIHNEEALRAVIDKPMDKLGEKVLSHVDKHAVAFIKKAPLLFLATSDTKHRQDVSPKGDAPGFVQIFDEKTLIIPDRPGNKLAYGFKNILDTGRAGLIFVIPGEKETLRINGQAFISKDPELLEATAAKGKPAVLCTILKVEECFFHCGKAFIRSKAWDSNTWPTPEKSKMAAQLANLYKVDAEIVEQTVNEDYENNLY